jgi:hypothetical protein
MVKFQVLIFLAVTSFTVANDIQEDASLDTVRKNLKLSKNQ